MTDSPFIHPPLSGLRRLKIFVYGESGTGKTTLACQFPAPVVFDLDGGAALYGEKYKFDVLQSTDLATIKNSIVWLRENPHDYLTVVIDPITVYWEVLQRWWSDVFLRRNTGYKQNKHEFYDLGPKEWNSIKSDFRGLFNKLLDLDMNVVVTCRETDKLERRGGDFVKVGTKADCDKSAPYMFDVVIRLFREDGKYMGEVIKDRTGSLPPAGAFEMSYKLLHDKLNIPSVVEKSTK
jgi:hypothetical protein